MTTNEESNSINEVELKRIYYENFIDELNDEELMYKKSVEELFCLFKSFGYIYSLVRKGNILTSKESYDSFLKSLVSFVDEMILNIPALLESGNSNMSANVNANTTTATGTTTTPGSTAPPSYTPSEADPAPKKRKLDIGDIDITTINGNGNGSTDASVNSATSMLCKSYIEELLHDINNVDENFTEANCVTDYLFILKNILKLKNAIVVEQVTHRFDKIKSILNVGKTIFNEDEVVDEVLDKNKKNEKIKKIYEYIDEMCSKLNGIEPIIKAIVHKQNFWSQNIMNKSEYDSMSSILNVDIDASKEEIDKVYEEVLLLLSDKMTQDKDNHFAREKLERMKANYDAEAQRRQQQELELSKKLDDKRKAVQFIIDRYNEYSWFDKSSPKKHSFYILGINPRLITEEELESFGKRLKHMLHPDKEPNKEWKEKAESAFKEASLAIGGCKKEFKSKVLKHLEPGPMAPYLSLIGLDSHAGYGPAPTPTPTSAPTTNTNANAKNQVNETAKVVTKLPDYYPTKAYYPKFELKCVDQKVGTILIDVKCPLTLGVIKKVILYVHRPIYGDEPNNLIPEDSFLSSREEQNVNVKNLNQPIELKVDYVQPLEIASSIKYYIGVQLIAERGNTMINWNSINITLHKFSNKNIIRKLLSSFKNAPFINQTKLNVVLSSEDKEEMSKFLYECIAQAKKWAQTV